MLNLGSWWVHSGVCVGNGDVGGSSSQSVNGWLRVTCPAAAGDQKYGFLFSLQNCPNI